MKLIFKQLLALSIFLMNTSNSAEHTPLDAFPPAQDGMQRYIIHLPHKERGEEDSFKIELIVGKVMLTDGVNVVRLSKTIQPYPLQGWGYTYYEVAGDDTEITTLIAPPENSPKVMQFVTGTSILIRYNSRIPVVVYAPEGYQIKYRIWQAPEQFEVAQEG